MIVPTPARATGTNTIGTAYGLEIDAQKTAFVTTAYAINQLGASDLNYLAGVTSIGTTAANAVLNIGTSGVDSEAQAIQMVVPESAAGSARIGLHTTAGRQQAYIKLSKLLSNTTRKGQIDLMLNPGTLEDGIAGLSIIDTGAGTGASNVGISTQLAGVGVTYQKLNVNGSQLFVGADSSQESPMLQIVPSYATNTHASYKARAIVSIWDIGGARSALQIDTDGSKASVQINSLHYGSMYADDITQVVTIGSAGAYVKVPGSMTVGLCNGFTLASSRELTCTIAGTYKVAWSMSVYSGSNNEIIGGAAMVNTTEAHQTENASECINSGKPVSISGHGEITLAVNDVVALCVENETAAHDITVTHANLSVIRIGA